MSFLFGRLIAAIAGMSAFGFVGFLIGRSVGAPGWGAWVGGSVGLLLVNLRDAWRSQALITWLRGDLEGSAPRGGELWGELAYRIERALQLRERALKAERAQLEQFLSAIEASPNGVLLLDIDEQIRWCNSVAADHFGLDPQRDRGQRITNLVRAPAFVAHLQGGPSDDAVTVIDHGRGLTLSVLVRRYGDGLVLVLTNDVTERLKAEAMRRDFVANVSHEIRTPLTVLAGFVETMASLPVTETERARMLVLMTQQTQRMQALVADLLTLARLEGSPRPPVDQWVPLQRVWDAVETQTAQLSQGRHILRFDRAGSDTAADHPIDADRDAAERVDDGALPALAIAGSESELLSAFSNLCSNAIRYTPAGGRIELLWRRRSNGDACFEVHDTGPGIAREHLARLTERFYRVDGSRSRETGGTGLGLSIVKHVMQRHGGRLEIESEPGQGSVFRLVLPAVRVRQDVAEGATVD